MFIFLSSESEQKPIDNGPPGMEPGGIIEVCYSIY
jgi:hypothetical protein